MAVLGLARSDWAGGPAELFNTTTARRQDLLDYSTQVPGFRPTVLNNDVERRAPAQRECISGRLWHPPKTLTYVFGLRRDVVRRFEELFNTGPLGSQDLLDYSTQPPGFRLTVLNNDGASGCRSRRTKCCT
jgi:hypothetical protein